MDRDAELREFVTGRGVALSRAAFLLTGDHQAAEDLVQDTYVVMVQRWQKAMRVDPEAYVRRILYSRFVDGWRRRRLLELPWSTPPDRAADDLVEAATDRIALRAALDRLTPRQRAVLVLRFYEDQTESQAADVLGVSPNTVKSQTRVALQRLRELAPDTVAEGEANTWDVWVMNVDGVRVVIMTEYFPETPATIKAELRRMAESIRFLPRPT